MVASDEKFYNIREGEIGVFCIKVLSGENGQNFNVTISTSDVTAAAGGDRHLTSSNTNPHSLLLLFQQRTMFLSNQSCSLLQTLPVSLLKLLTMIFLMTCLRFSSSRSPQMIQLSILSPTQPWLLSGTMV